MRLLICVFSLLFITACMSGEHQNPAPRMASTRLAAAGTAATTLAASLGADRILGRDGAALPLERWMPEGAPRAIVLGIHGFNDYSHAFAQPGAMLARQGIATFAYDQRGFGRAPDRGRWAGTDAMTKDLEEVTELVHARYPDTPVYLMGLSMGCAVKPVSRLMNSRASSGLAERAARPTE